jgi:hypothetical protein
MKRESRTALVALALEVLSFLLAVLIGGQMLLTTAYPHTEDVVCSYLLGIGFGALGSRFSALVRERASEKTQ